MNGISAIARDRQRALRGRRGRVLAQHRAAPTVALVALLWWSDIESFARDLCSATDDRLAEMHRWAGERESDRPGIGRNPKARRMFRQMRQSAEERLDERGLLWRLGHLPSPGAAAHSRAPATGEGYADEALVGQRCLYGL